MVQDEDSTALRNTSSENIDNLVQEAGAGNDNAFITLWKIFYPKILSYLRRFTRNAEDLCSEVWIRIAGSIRGFTGNGSAFQAWIFTIARNLAIDDARANKRRGSTVELRDEDWIASESSAIEITDLLDRLPIDQAEIILLRVVIGFSVEEVAKITGKTVSNVKVLSHRGLNKLKLELETSGYRGRGGAHGTITVAD